MSDGRSHRAHTALLIRRGSLPVCEKAWKGCRCALNGRGCEPAQKMTAQELRADRCEQPDLRVFWWMRMTRLPLFARPKASRSLSLPPAWTAEFDPRLL